MKSHLAFLPFLLLITLLFTVVACGKKEGTGGGSDVIYTCSMHPQVRQKGPGNCPICGMKLTPLTPAPATSSIPATPSTTTASLATPGPNEVMVDAARSSVSSIKIEPAGPRRLIKTIQIFGEIQYISDRHVDYTWYYSGRIQKVLVDFNTNELRKGEPVFEVYSEAAIADQDAYLGALRDRYLSTFYERAVLTSRIDAIAARLRQIGFDDASLKALVEKKQVRRTFTIRSPINGSIVGDIPHVGERFESNTVLLHITDLSEVWFNAEVFEQDLSLLKLGEKVHLTSRARPGQTYTGKLVFIDRRLNPEKRTVRARFEVPNPNRELLPQLSATGTLEVTLGEVPVTVPSSAVIDTGRRKVVYVQIGPDRYEPRNVEVGGEGHEASVPDSGTRFFAITSGLKAGENVVTGGAFLIDAEAQLQGATGTSEVPPSPGGGQSGHTH